MFDLFIFLLFVCLIIGLFDPAKIGEWLAKLMKGYRDFIK
jgi:Na+/H+ antiporter NhaC